MLFILSATGVCLIAWYNEAAPAAEKAKTSVYLQSVSNPGHLQQKGVYHEII